MMLDKLRDSNNVVGLAYLPIAMRAFTNSKHPICLLYTSDAADE